MVALVTTIDRESTRVLVHSTRREIVRRQAALLDLPLIEVSLPESPSNALYSLALGGALTELRDRAGITGVASGDLHLADVRAFREGIAEQVGVESVFPLWGMRSDLLARAMLQARVSAHLVVVDPNRIDPGWVGHAWDQRWIESLPSKVDPCGENGEFHTLVSAGPMFPASIPIRFEGVTERAGFAYADFSTEGTAR